MASLKNVLAPGERIVLRNTDDRLAWWRAGMLLLLFGDIGLSNFLQYDVRDAKFWETAALMLVMPLFILLWAWAGRIWLWVATDRRILAREKPSEPLLDLPPEAIEAVTYADGALRLEAGGDVLSLPISDRFCGAGKLRALLGDKLGTPGHPLAPLAEIVPGNEKLTLRQLPEFSILNAVNPLLLAAGAIVTLAYFLPRPLFSGLPGLGSVIPVFYVLGFAELVANWRRRGWWIAVTDRQLLLRRWHEPERYDAVAITDIGDVAFDPKRSRLLFRLKDRELFLHCTKWGARRVFAALGREPAEALA